MSLTLFFFSLQVLSIIINNYICKSLVSISTLEVNLNYLCDHISLIWLCCYYLCDLIFLLMWSHLFNLIMLLCSLIQYFLFCRSFTWIKKGYMCKSLALIQSIEQVCIYDLFFLQLYNCADWNLSLSLFLFFLRKKETSQNICI